VRISAWGALAACLGLLCLAATPVTTLCTRRVRGTIHSCLLLALLVLAPADGGAQPSAKVRRVGVLSSFSGPLSAQPEFGRALGKLGYVEGRDFVLEPRYANRRYDQLPSLAAELVRLNVDVILALGTIAARAAKQTTTTIPIVVLSGDPVAAGLVTSIARPGANITGLSRMSADVGAKRLQLLKEAVPGASRVAVLWSHSQPLHGAYMKALEAVASPLGVRLHAVEVRGPADLEHAFVTIAGARAHALFVLGDPMFIDHRRRLVRLAARHRLPTSFGEEGFAENGGLMSYGESYSESFRRAAAYADKILKGAKPADLPIEQPTRFELVINLKTAKALGLTIPDFLLARADKVIR
jgi:putative ABC transport system substrate-binding protein